MIRQQSVSLGSCIDTGIDDFLNTTAKVNYPPCGVDFGGLPPSGRGTSAGTWLQILLTVLKELLFSTSKYESPENIDYRRASGEILRRDLFRKGRSPVGLH